MKSTIHTHQKNSFKLVSKNQIKKIGLFALASILFASCTNNDNTTAAPTADAFKGINEAGIKKNTQNFTATAGSGTISLTSAKGVLITLNGNALTKNGNPVTGSIDITFIEIFDKGNMLITNKPTMGVMPDGKKSLLKSGGEFFIKASQGGVDLATTAGIQLQVPANLTGTIDTGMTFWAGDTTDAENLAWVQPVKLPATTGGQKEGNVDFKQNTYYVSFGNFGWTNVDKFYSDPRPKTTILVTVPTGYDNANSAVYLSYDGEGQNALAKLDTYNPTTKQFSEHYGQIPVGLACHVIFVTEDNGNWRYAIKGVTVAAGDIYNFTMSETTVVTQAQLVTAINAIQ